MPKIIGADHNAKKYFRWQVNDAFPADYSFYFFRIHLFRLIHGIRH